MNKLSPTKKLTLGAMCIALTILALFAAANIKVMKIASYFLSGVFIFALTYERAYVMAILAFLASCGIGFLIIADKVMLIPYIALIGHYGIFKDFISEKIQDKFVAFVVRMLYCNLFFAIAAVLGIFVFSADVAEYLQGYKLWVVVGVFEAAFIGNDLLMSAVRMFYATRIRSALVGK